MPFFVYNVLRETILTIDVKCFALPRVTDNINTFRIDFLKHSLVGTKLGKQMPKWYMVKKFHDDVIKWNIFRVTGRLWRESSVTGEFSPQRPVTWSFDVSFYLRLNKRLSKQLGRWWFETPSRTLWRHCNVVQTVTIQTFLNHSDLETFI